MAAEKYIFARLLLETTKIAKFYFKLKKQQGMQNGNYTRKLQLIFFAQNAKKMSCRRSREDTSY